MSKHRIFSGIQPTGEPHLGNYLGAIRHWVDLQEQPDPLEAIYSIVDYHALTVEQDPQVLRRRTLEMAASLLACGLDPERVVLFRQSDVPEHTELAWIFSTCAQMGELERMTQFKDKASQHQANVNVGLFSYPVLQAADILLYRADRVPVGEDQVQHLELSREIVRRFNRRYGPVFPEPAAVLSPVPRLRGLDGDAKMSKSKGNTIAIGDPEPEIRQKLRSAVTDPQRRRRNDPGDPTICNIYALHGSFTSSERVGEIGAACRTAAIGCVECKTELGDRIVEHFDPIRCRLEQGLADPGVLDEVLEAGCHKASELAKATMEVVRHSVGVGPS